MSETSKVALGKEVSSLDISPQFEAYSGVEIIVTDEITYLAGNRNGRVLTIENPWGTKAQATAILNALQAKGFQYQPYTADGAILNPAAEIGDGITISDTYSGLYKIDRKYSPLMKADVEAPQDEELDHEYPYTPKQDRIYKREIAEANAQISLNADAITAEVTRVDTQVLDPQKTNPNSLNSQLSSSIEQTATEIGAEVTRVTNNKLDHTHTSTSFGWKLTDSKFEINKSGSQNVFTADSSGITIQGNATVTGKIQATSGYIGSSETNGFKITSTYIANKKTSRTDANTGVYIGTDGIALGANSAFMVTSAGAVTAKNLSLQGGSITIKNSSGQNAFTVSSTGAVTASNLSITGGSIKIGSNFSVTSAGNVTANNMTLKGTLTVGSSTITADRLRQGANDGYSWGSGGGSYGGYTSRAEYALGGAGGYLNATNSGSGSYPSYFKATSIYGTNLYASEDMYVSKGGSNLSLGRHYHSFSVDGGTIKIGMPQNQQGSFKIADTKAYKDGVSAAYSEGSAAGRSGVSVSSVTVSYVIGNTAYIRIILSNGSDSTYPRVLP